MRSLQEQLTHICAARGVLKKSIARRMGITDVYLSQMIKRGMSQERLEQLADVLGVDPADFDLYVYLRASDIVAGDDTILVALRERLRGSGTDTALPKPKTNRSAIPRSAELLTVQEVCQMLRCSRHTVYRLMDDGHLRYKKLPRARGRRVPAEDVRKLMAL